MDVCLLNQNNHEFSHLPEMFIFLLVGYVPFKQEARQVKRGVFAANFTSPRTVMNAIAHSCKARSLICWVIRD